MAKRERWQVAGDAAEIYQRELVPAVFGPRGPRVVELAALRAALRVLDVACGTGLVARLAEEGSPLPRRPPPLWLPYLVIDSSRCRCDPGPRPEARGDIANGHTQWRSRPPIRGCPPGRKLELEAAEDARGSVQLTLDQLRACWV